jgi:cytochrome c5
MAAMAALALLSILSLSSGVLAIAGMVKATSRSAPVPYLQVEGTREQIRRGEQIVASFCGACHSAGWMTKSSRPSMRT